MNSLRLFGAKKLLKFLRIAVIMALLAPFVNVAVLLVACLRDDLPFVPNVVERINLETQLMAGSLYALRHARYPSLVEMQRLPIYELIISLVLCWLLVSLLAS